MHPVIKARGNTTPERREDANVSVATTATCHAAGPHREHPERREHVRRRGGEGEGEGEGGEGGRAAGIGNYSERFLMDPHLASIPNILAMRPRLYPTVHPSPRSNGTIKINRSFCSVLRCRVFLKISGVVLPSCSRARMFLAPLGREPRSLLLHPARWIVGRRARSPFVYLKST